MPAGRPRLHSNQAEKQFAYRQRQSDARAEERVLATRARQLAEVAKQRNQVITDAPVWAQLDELAQ